MNIKTYQDIIFRTPPPGSEDMLYILADQLQMLTRIAYQSGYTLEEVAGAGIGESYNRGGSISATELPKAGDTVRYKEDEYTVDFVDDDGKLLISNAAGEAMIEVSDLDATTKMPSSNL